MAKQRRGKYNVAPKKDRTYKGVVYMSKHEMNTKKHLELLMKATGKDKVISIVEQFPFDCVINGKKICKYICDFKVEYADGRVEYIDSKGVRTAIYNLKKKLVESLFNIKIREIYAKDI